MAKVSKFFTMFKKFWHISKVNKDSDPSFLRNKKQNNNDIRVKIEVIFISKKTSN